MKKKLMTLIASAMVMVMVFSMGNTAYAAGITNEMSDYEKCVRVNDYLCKTFEYGFTEMQLPYMIVGADGILTIIGDNRAGGLKTDLFQYGKGVCSDYADAFQTMASLLSIESYTYGSFNLNHGWNAVVIEVFYEFYGQNG